MQTIRAQNLIPEVYTDESRDFQILCRLYDSIYNGIKYDADSIKYIVDARNIQSGLLPLLQTKLGFLTKKNLNDTEIRYVLRVFPELVRNKGSLNAIRKLLNMCLKLNNISGAYTISYSDKATVINGISINSHTIIVGLDSIIKNTELINEIARYILPAGFSFYIYFYKNYSAVDELYLNEDVKLLYSSSNLNAQIRGTRNNSDGYIDYDMPLDNDEMSYDLLGGVDIAWINSIDSAYSDKFLGFYNSVSELPTGTNGDLAITYSDTYPLVYYYHSSAWRLLNFRGYCELSNSSPQVSNPANYDIVCSPRETSYLLYVSSAWRTCNFLGMYDSITEVTAPQQYDLIVLNDDSQTSYKYYNGSTWVNANYKATYSNESQVSDSYKTTNSLIILTGAKYFLRLNNAWTVFTDPVYMLKKYVSENDSLGE